MILIRLLAASALAATLLGSTGPFARSAGFLAVADIANGRVLIFDSGLRHVRNIRKGISPDPGGMRYDQSGNLYVVDLRSGVFEYNPGGKRPAFEYTNVTGPGQVALDSTGDVYITNYDGHRHKTWVSVFPHRSNTLKRRYNVLGKGGVGGMAFDKHGNLFVSYFAHKVISAPPSGIEEFQAGSTQGHDLGILLSFAGGLRVDTNDNIIVCDSNTQSVKVFPEGSTQASQSYGGFVVPGDVALDESNSTLFVSDEGSGTVAVMTYPDGRLEKTLGQRDGIEQSGNIATFPNAF